MAFFDIAPLYDVQPWVMVALGLAPQLPPGFSKGMLPGADAAAAQPGAPAAAPQQHSEGQIVQAQDSAEVSALFVKVRSLLCLTSSYSLPSPATLRLQHT